MKTRLARDLGERDATALYRQMGRHVADRVRAGDYRTKVHFSPSEAEASVRAWLGEERLIFIPQTDGGLGERLRSAFARAFEMSDRVVAIGTDAPDLSQEEIEEAFALLEPGTAVLGPATDGGYYLLGLSEPCPDALRDIPWSTDAVLGRTRQRLVSAGLAVHTLPVKSDIDRASDLRRVEWTPSMSEAGSEVP